MQTLQRHKQLLSFECTLPAQLTHISIHLKSFYRTSAGSYRPSVVDSAFDMCAVLRSEKLDSAGLMARSMMKIMMTDSNLEQCPLNGTVFFNNIRLTPDLVLNTWMPAHRYRLDCRFYDGRTNVTIIFVQVFFAAGVES